MIVSEARAGAAWSSLFLPGAGAGADPYMSEPDSARGPWPSWSTQKVPDPCGSGSTTLEESTLQARLASFSLSVLPCSILQKSEKSSILKRRISWISPVLHTFCFKGGKINWRKWDTLIQTWLWGRILILNEKKLT